MGVKLDYAVMGFRHGRKGALERVGPSKCADADAARVTAERLATRRGYAGAVAIACAGLDDQDPITIAAFGDVPPEARDVVPF